MGILLSHANCGNEPLFRGDDTTIKEFMDLPLEPRLDSELAYALDTTAWRLIMMHSHGTLTPSAALTGQTEIEETLRNISQIHPELTQDNFVSIAIANCALKLCVEYRPAA